MLVHGGLHLDPRHAFTADDTLRWAPPPWHVERFKERVEDWGKPETGRFLRTFLITSSKARIYLHTLERSIDFIIGFIVYKNLV